MADLFGNRGFWQDSGCVSTEKKEGKTEDSDLVLICFQISVWSGTTTEFRSSQPIVIRGPLSPRMTGLKGSLFYLRRPYG